MSFRTPFYEKHLALGGKMINFQGWELPVQYSTITNEHHAVRNKVGLFDISHMGQILVWGKQAKEFLQYLLTNDLEKAVIGKGIYAHLLNEQGGVIDDIFVYGLEEEKFLLIVNASRREVDFSWMKEKKMGFEVDLMEMPFAAGLALQGPQALNLLKAILPAAAQLEHHRMAEFELGEVTTLLSRTGYTGEDGFEFFAPAGHLLLLWDQIVSAGKAFGLTPCGLGARDTLRTEVAYPLYGHELDETHTPLQAGLDWVVKFEKGDFMGRQALLHQKDRGLESRLIGFKITQGGVARPGGKVLIKGQECGTVTSGTFGPTLGVPIGMAYLPMEIPMEGANLTILQGQRELGAVTVKRPFYSRPVPTIK